MVKEDVDGAEDPRFSLLSTRSLMLFQALVTTGCFIVLGGLTVWHAKLISKGETSIEAHINRCGTRLNISVHSSPLVRSTDIRSFGM